LYFTSFVGLAPSLRRILIKTVSFASITRRGLFHLISSKKVWNFSFLRPRGASLASTLASSSSLNHVWLAAPTRRRRRRSPHTSRGKIENRVRPIIRRPLSSSLKILSDVLSVQNNFVVILSQRLLRKRKGLNNHTSINNVLNDDDDEEDDLPFCRIEIPPRLSKIVWSESWRENGDTKRWMFRKKARALKARTKLTVRMK